MISIGSLFSAILICTSANTVFMWNIFHYGIAKVDGAVVIDQIKNSKLCYPYAIKLAIIAFSY